MTYRNAWNCKRCPQRADADGCPAWVEYMQENVASGEQRLHKECLFQALPVFLTEVIRASNRPAAAVESVRNELAQGLGALALAARRLPGPDAC